LHLWKSRMRSTPSLTTTLPSDNSPHRSQANPCREKKTRQRATSRKEKNALCHKSRGVFVFTAQANSRPPINSFLAVEVRHHAAGAGWLRYATQAPALVESLSSGFAIGHEAPPRSTPLRQPTPHGRQPGGLYQPLQGRDRLFSRLPAVLRFLITLGRR
jgi:hypothetical protein